MEKNKIKWNSIRVPEGLAQEVSRFVEKSSRYRNRNEFCVEAIRVYLMKVEE